MTEYFRRHLTDYGMILVLLLLCAFFSVRTMSDQTPNGADAGRKLAEEIAREAGAQARVMIAVRDQADDAAFADALSIALTMARLTVVEAVKGEPKDARAAL